MLPFGHYGRRHRWPWRGHGWLLLHPVECHAHAALIGGGKCYTLFYSLKYEVPCTAVRLFCASQPLTPCPRGCVCVDHPASVSLISACQLTKVLISPQVCSNISHDDAEIPCKSFTNQVKSCSFALRTYSRSVHIDTFDTAVAVLRGG